MGGLGFRGFGGSGFWGWGVPGLGVWGFRASRVKRETSEGFSCLKANRSLLPSSTADDKNPATPVRRNIP